MHFVKFLTNLVGMHSSPVVLPQLFGFITTYCFEFPAAMPSFCFERAGMLDVYHGFLLCWMCSAEQSSVAVSHREQIQDRA